MTRRLGSQIINGQLVYVHGYMEVSQRAADEIRKQFCWDPDE